MIDRPPRFVVAVVDDDPGILRSIEYLLESADYVARSFVSGAQLLESGRLAEIDCLISDLDMPGMGGLELIEWIRATRPGLPIILITGLPSALTQLSRVDRGSHRLFTKPFRGSELLAAVRDALKNSVR